jgi:hypothetical protein
LLVARYFFFAAFLAAFFAGAFLAAFFVAICLFSLFDGLHRSCNRYTAVEECIDSSCIGVKRKTTWEWKKEQQSFRTRSFRAMQVRIETSIKWRGVGFVKAPSLHRSRCAVLKRSALLNRQ